MNYDPYVSGIQGWFWKIPMANEFLLQFLSEPAHRIKQNERRIVLHLLKGGYKL